MVRAEDVLPVIAYSAEIFEFVEASFIWGYPFEELEDFKMTLDLAGRVSQWAPKVNVQLHRLSPLPNSPIYKEYPGPLLEPDPRDKPWLLLPAVLLEPEAAAIGRLVRAAPDVYPGFFTLPTPEEGEKRLMGMVKRTLDRTIGATLFDPDTARLLDEEAPESERGALRSRDGLDWTHRSRPGDQLLRPDPTTTTGRGLRASGRRSRALTRQGAESMSDSLCEDRPCVFIGPSLPLDEARLLIDADFRPPVRRGDLAALDPARLVVIIDGEFHQSFSVSPNEILRLLDLGGTVVGASSMGALRAAELADFGMIGLGWVFAAYYEGVIVGDDEVALAYCPFGLQALTVPVVNVRHWLGRIESAGLIDAVASARALRRARQVFYADRTPEAPQRGGRHGARTGTLRRSGVQASLKSTT